MCLLIQPAVALKTTERVSQHPGPSGASEASAPPGNQQSAASWEHSSCVSEGVSELLIIKPFKKNHQPPNANRNVYNELKTQRLLDSSHRRSDWVTNGFAHGSQKEVTTPTFSLATSNLYVPCATLCINLSAGSTPKRPPPGTRRPGATSFLPVLVPAPFADAPCPADSGTLQTTDGP